MHHFQYKDGVLCAEDVRLDRLAEEVGTPFYCYSTATLERHYKVFAGALPAGSLVAFSVKANGNLAVLKTLARLGAGAVPGSAGLPGGVNRHTNRIRKSAAGPWPLPRLTVQTRATLSPEDRAPYVRAEQRGTSAFAHATRQRGHKPPPTHLIDREHVRERIGPRRPPGGLVRRDPAGHAVSVHSPSECGRCRWREHNCPPVRGLACPAMAS